MKISPIFTDDIPLMAIGYKYISQKVLGFIDTEGGQKYCYSCSLCILLPHNYSNVSICPILCPFVIGGYFGACNAIVNQNRISQSDLSLYKFLMQNSDILDL